MEDRAELRKFTKPETMVQSIRAKVDRNSALNTPRLDKFCKKINNFASAMAPFFEVVDIFVNTHPEWVGVFWRSLRLLFKVPTFSFPLTILR